MFFIIAYIGRGAEWLLRIYRDLAANERPETLRSALGDTFEYQSEGQSRNPQRNPNVSPRAKRRVYVRSLGTEIFPLT